MISYYSVLFCNPNLALPSPFLLVWVTTSFLLWLDFEIQLMLWLIAFSFGIQCLNLIPMIGISEALIHIVSLLSLRSEEQFSLFCWVQGIYYCQSLPFYFQRLKCAGFLNWNLSPYFSFSDNLLPAVFKLSVVFASKFLWLTLGSTENTLCHLHNITQTLPCLITSVAEMFVQIVVTSNHSTSSSLLPRCFPFSHENLRFSKTRLQSLGYCVLIHIGCC